MTRGARGPITITHGGYTPVASTAMPGQSRPVTAGNIAPDVYQGFADVAKRRNTTKSGLARLLIERAVANPEAFAAFLGEQA